MCSRATVRWGRTPAKAPPRREKVFYNELKRQAREAGIDLVGFTRVPADLVFQGKHVLYPNAIVCAQEMKRSAIEQAPRAAAGMEALHVYADLGESMNRLAGFLRSRGIPCQVSHPLGGLLLYPALAARAGLGYFGRQGLLITPEFGVRQRLGIILVPLEDMPWGDPDRHRWVLDFCDHATSAASGARAGPSTRGPSPTRGRPLPPSTT